MARSQFVLLLACLVLSPVLLAQAITPQASAPQASSPPPPTAQNISTPSSRKAKQVVDAAIQAMGGERYLQHTDTSGQGLSYSFNSAGELANPGVQFWSYNRFPSQERMEMTKKRNVVYIFSDGKGWQITFKGVEPMPRQAVQRAKDSFDHSIDMILKRWAENPQTLMLDQGLSLVDVTQVESVSFLTASGEGAIVDFSILSHLPIRVRWRVQDPLTGGHYEESVIYGNWINQGGIELPYLVDRFQGNQRLAQTSYTNMSLAPLDASLFVPKPLKK